MRGRRPTPTYLKLLRGNPGQRAIQASVAAPRPPAPPACPEYLTGYALEEWNETAPELHALNCLSPLDLALFGAYCEAVKRWRTATEKLAEMEARDPVTAGLIVRTQSGGAATNPLVAIVDNAARTMARLAGEFGLSPSARSRLTVGEPPAPSKFRGLIAGSGQ
jgi:P27 family predicted phage terminase small subunit